MASLFGVIKKMFGGGEKPAANETVQDSVDGKESSGNIVTDAMASGQDALNTVKEQASSVVESVTETVSEAASETAEQVQETLGETVSDTVSNVTETVSSTVDHVAEAAANTVSEVANSEIVQEAESAVIAAAGAVGGVSGAMTEAVTDMVQTAAGVPNAEIDEGGMVPSLPPLVMKETIDYLDRDNFVVPRSDSVIKAIALVDETVGQDATARALRIFEYGVAASHAYELRVDREILLLGSLLGQLGSEAPKKAEAFCIENGMWDALAKKVAFAIENNETGTTTDDVEARALALGVAAEMANGEVDYVHAATAAETRNRNVH